MNAVVDSSIKLVENLIEKSTNNLVLKYGGNLPLIQGSFQRLEQVLVNLIQNACHSLNSKEKELFISTEYNSSLKMVVVTIKDEGSGMDEEIRKKIFDPFFTTKKSEGGTGLGLSVSSKIINDHGGYIKFSSKYGTGTTAKIFLPINII